MAKKEIKYLSRTLAEFYGEAEETLSDAGLALKDIALSEEEQTRFSELKASVDNELSLLSVALSAAAQGRLNEVLKSKIEERNSFLEPLHLALNNLSDGDIDEETKSTTMSLIAAYNDKIDNIDVDIGTLRAVEVYADCPRRKENRKRYIKTLSLGERMDLEFLLKYKVNTNSFLSVFKTIRAALSIFNQYVKNTLEETEESTAGDLAE